MNNERAIELLHRLQDEQFDGQHGDERREALEMAVKALEGDGDTISRQATIDEVINLWADKPFGNPTLVEIKDCIEALPPAQQQYEPVTAEDFAKTMSENTIWQFAVWHGHALALMKEQGFVICKKAM